MTLKDYIGRAQLTEEEQTQLIRELTNEPSEFLSTCSLKEVPDSIREIIEKEGLIDGDVAYAIYEDYDTDDILRSHSEWTEEKKKYAEKSSIWFLKAAELGCDNINYHEDFNVGGDKIVRPYDMDYYTSLVYEAEAEFYNSWGCRFALGSEADFLIDDEDIDYDFARELFEESSTEEAKLSLYYIYSRGLGVKVNLKIANSYIKDIPKNTPLCAFKSNISDGIDFDIIEEKVKKTPQEEINKTRKSRKSRKPRKKNKIRSFFWKILSMFK